MFRRSLASDITLAVQQKQCWAIGQSGLPVQEELFNVSICEPRSPGFLEILTSSNKRKIANVYAIVLFTTLAPLIYHLFHSHMHRNNLRATNPVSISRPRTWNEPAPQKDMVWMNHDPAWA